MGIVQNIAKRIPSSPNLPSLEKLPSLGDLSRQRERITPRLAFFQRRIRLRGNSKISIPLGVVLLFPCIVIILILVLVVRHPSSPGGILLPAGAPPSIRYEKRSNLTTGAFGDVTEADRKVYIGESARNTIKFLSPAAWNRRRMDLEQMRHLWYWQETRN